MHSAVLLTLHISISRHIVWAPCTVVTTWWWWTKNKNSSMSKWPWHQCRLTLENAKGIYSSPHTFGQLNRSEFIPGVLSNYYFFWIPPGGIPHLRVELGGGGAFFARMAKDLVVVWVSTPNPLFTETSRAYQIVLYQQKPNNRTSWGLSPAHKSSFFHSQPEKAILPLKIGRK